MFEGKGFISVAKNEKGEDELFELALEAGAEDMKTTDEHFEIITAVESLETVRKALEDKGVKMETSELTRIPQNTISVDEKNCKQVLGLIDALEDHDDVQKVYSNIDISDEVLAAIEKDL